ncbi:MAG: patatin-like phospholipase family protein [Candidatus Krumholzibacteria bacterium]|nr:patatin-like phospholipase family protein [Candidatus Krumholzibacteria bacterium]
MSDRFQVLSLDGGGIKGVFSAAVLAAIEEDLSVKITDHFDLIAGTSTGGVIALGLGLGLTPKEMVEFYVSRGPAILSNPCGMRSLLHWAYRKFPQRALMKALKDPKVFGDKKLGESIKRLVIPSYNLGEDDVYLFKTPHHERLKRDWKVPAWKVAIATSAAPTYFPSSRHIDHVRHIDGGVWANNPTMVGIVEAVSMLNISLDQIYVLSLGTSDEVIRRSSGLDSGGKLAWANDAVTLILRGQSLGAYKQASHLLGMNKVLRLDPKVPDGLFALDKPNTKYELLAKAAHESRISMPAIETGFMQHKCRLYTPLYGTDETIGDRGRESNHGN